MIGVVVREMTFLKILAPVMRELGKNKAKYILYHFDAPRGDKEYNRATKAKILKSNPELVKGAVKIKAFKDDSQLQAQLVHDGVKKLVSLEIWLWAKRYIKFLKENEIQTFSILYLTDSLWLNSAKTITDIDRTYYSTPYLMQTHLDFIKLPFNPERDRNLGCPAFDPITKECGEDILVLLPNLKAEHVASAFGNETNFVKMIQKIHAGAQGKLIFKTRQKQWLPESIKGYAKEIVDDGEVMYPPAIANIFKRTFCTVMFFSSGVYESVYANNHVYNIPLPLKRWAHDKDKMKSYFDVSSGANSLYNWPGVVTSVEQNVVKGDWEFQPEEIDSIARDSWLDRYVGCKKKDSAKDIAYDIMAA